MKDKYDKAIAYLTEHPEEIYNNWLDWRTSPAGCLFSFANEASFPYTEPSGCLTMIRYKYSVVINQPKLTEEIRNDTRIPERGNSITLKHLPIFAEWQRKLDKELGENRI